MGRGQCCNISVLQKDRLSSTESAICLTLKWSWLLEDCKDNNDLNRLRCFQHYKYVGRCQEMKKVVANKTLTVFIGDFGDLNYDEMLVMGT